MSWANLRLIAFVLWKSLQIVHCIAVLLIVGWYLGGSRKSSWNWCKQWHCTLHWTHAVQGDFADLSFYYFMKQAANVEINLLKIRYYMPNCVLCISVPIIIDWMILAKSRLIMCWRFFKLLHESHWSLNDEPVVVM